MLEQATRNSKTWQALTLKTQTQLNSSTKILEKLVLLEPKLEILKQKSSLIHAWTRQFETWWNSNSKWVRSSTNTYEYWANTWKMCSPTSVILVSIVTSFEAFLKRFSVRINFKSQFQSNYLPQTIKYIKKFTCRWTHFSSIG